MAFGVSNEVGLGGEIGPQDKFLGNVEFAVKENVDTQVKVIEEVVWFWEEGGLEEGGGVGGGFA